MSGIGGGSVVMLEAIPLSIACGLLANLTPQHGIYSYLMGSTIMNLFFWNSNVTPSPIAAIMIQGLVAKIGPGVTLLALMASLGMIVIGLLGGLLLVLMLRSQIRGIIAAAYLTIATAQLPSLFGISSTVKGNDFIDIWKNVIVHIGEARFGDVVLGFCSIGLLVILKRIEGIYDQGCWKHVALLRNSVVLFIGICLAYVFSGLQPFELIGHVNAALPELHIPPMWITHNGTYYSFFDMVSTMGTSIIMIPLVCILEMISLKNYPRILLSFETLFLGICNLAVAFFSPIVVTGTVAENAVNNGNGFRSKPGHFVSTAMVVLALPILENAFYYIPKATLASVVIMALISMMDSPEMADIWREKCDRLLFLGAMNLCVFLGLGYGILIVIATNILLCISALYHNIKPNV